MRLLFLALVAVILVPAAVAAYPPPGSPAPDFTLPDTAYVNHSLSDYHGQVVWMLFWQST